jgi:Ca-activated chloride channel family protein
LVMGQATGQDMVYVLASVKDSKKAPVSGIGEQSFQITEDDVEQKIAAFFDADGPWDIDLIVAHSLLKPGRPDAISRGVRNAIDTFQAEANPKTHIIVRELKFGSDGLYPVIDDSLLDLQKSTNPRRALVVITDGFDRPYSNANTVSDVGHNVATDSGNRLIEYSRKLNIPIFFLYSVLNGDLTALNNQELADKEALTIVAEQTGGVFVHTDPINNLETASKVLASELRSKYVLGYISTNLKKDDKWRRLKLKFTAPQGQKLDASIKKKYFVPKPPK